jgi:hypothetical protein
MQIGFDIATGGLTQDKQTAGGNVIVDGVVTNTPTFIRTSNTSPSFLSGSLVLDNIKLSGVIFVTLTLNLANFLLELQQILEPLYMIRLRRAPFSEVERLPLPTGYKETCMLNSDQFCALSMTNSCK